MLLAAKFVFNQDFRRLLLSAPGLNHLPYEEFRRGLLCEASNKLIVAINQPAEIAADNSVSGVRWRQILREWQAENHLAGIILDLNGIVLWIMASGCEHLFEVSGTQHHGMAGSLHIRVIEAGLVVTHTSIFAADVKVEARHGVPQSYPVDG